MARFVALLLIGPWLAVLAWLYWLYVRKSHATPQAMRHDVIVVAASFALAIVGDTVAWQAALGHGGPIWKQVAAALGTYAGFTVVMAYGLSRHWWRRRQHGLGATRPAIQRPGQQRPS